MTEELTMIKDYLQLVIEAARSRPAQNAHWPYCCIEDFVLRNGKHYSEMAAKRIKKGEAKLCFMNSYKFAEKYGFGYVEGYSITSLGLPMLHAWNTTVDGRIVDSTWKDGRAYFGVELPLWYVNKVIFRRESYGVLDCWEIGWPLLTGKHRWPLNKKEFTDAEINPEKGVALWPQRRSVTRL